MKSDPLVEEVRQAGENYIASFKGDWKALAADLNRRAQAEGREVISRPPVPSDPRRQKHQSRF
jgi:hypothetical protein